MAQIITSRQYTGWEIIKAFWQSEKRWLAYFVFSVVMLMTIILVGLSVSFNYWYNFFYNALQAYDKEACIRLLMIFAGLATLYIIFAVYRFYIAQMFGLRWRKWLTDQLINRWLVNRSYYYLENFDERTDNPDQRIQEDAGAIVTYSLDLSIGLVSAVTTFLAFIYILWTLSGVITIPLGPLGNFQLYGYLVWVGIIYALVGTYFTFKIGNPLVGLNFEQQRREATFRFAAMDLRSHAENVALYDGEHHQKGILNNLFGKVLDNWYQIIVRQKSLLWFTAGYNQLAVFLPLVVALPNYFDKVFLLGGLIQTLQAFGQVQDSLSFLVNSYTKIAEWQAILQRLTTFVNHLDEVEIKADQENKLTVDHSNRNEVVTKGVTISTPREKVLLENIDTTLTHGQNYLIKGMSGIGKSTFLRAIAGIWPFAEGEISLPENKKMMFLPQKSYMPLGTLMEAILFPDKKYPELENQVKNILEETRLGHLIPRLNDVAPWSEQLSPGEQQRVAFARILLHKPDWVFMDETTSMLDLNNEKYLYALLKEKLPHCSVVSVGHRPSLEAYHDHVIDMEKYKA